MSPLVIVYKYYVFVLSDEEGERFTLSSIGIQAVILMVTVIVKLRARYRSFMPSICFTMRCTLSKNPYTAMKTELVD